MKRAFTLIELLVVIAIIAILAAILFPVFAQAKVAAKKTAQLAQFKQVATAGFIYMGDVDDTAPVSYYKSIGSTLTTPGGNTITDPATTWCKSYEPYVKNWPLVNDPNTFDPLKVWSPGPANWYYNWMRWPGLGLNVNYFNNAGGDCAGFGTTPGLPEFGLPISMTSIASPSGTIMFSSAKRVGTPSVGAYRSHSIESPGSYLANDTCSWSNGGWGIGSFGDTPNWYPGNPTSTGDFATNYANQGIVVFADSSAKSLPPGRVAAGTDWKVGIANSAINITDRAQYLWDTAQ